MSYFIINTMLSSKYFFLSQHDITFILSFIIKYFATYEKIHNLKNILEKCRCIRKGVMSKKNARSCRTDFQAVRCFNANPNRLPCHISDTTALSHAECRLRKRWVRAFLREKPEKVRILPGTFTAETRYRKRRAKPRLKGPRLPLSSLDNALHTRKRIQPTFSV